MTRRSEQTCLNLLWPEGHLNLCTAFRWLVSRSPRTNSFPHRWQAWRGTSFNPWDYKAKSIKICNLFWTRRYFSRMSTARLPTVLTSYWRSLNMSGDRGILVQWGPRGTSLNMPAEHGVLFGGKGGGRCLWTDRHNDRQQTLPTTLLAGITKSDVINFVQSSKRQTFLGNLCCNYNHGLSVCRYQSVPSKPPSPLAQW